LHVDTGLGTRYASSSGTTTMMGDAMKTKKLLGKALLGAALAIASFASHASLIYLGPVTIGGAGIGAVSTVLTLADNSGQGCCTSTGAVAYNGSTDVLSGDAQAGALSQTWALGDLAWTSASTARIVFNANEPAGNGITLDNLVMTIYSSTGVALWNSGAFAGYTFGATNNGIGNAGELFGLDAAQTLAANAYFGDATNRIGLLATISDAAGGHDTFFLSLAAPCTGPDCGGGSTGNVPEPASLLLVGLGLLSLRFARRIRPISK
jgi:hypothetical protein